MLFSTTLITALLSFAAALPPPQHTFSISLSISPPLAHPLIDEYPIEVCWGAVCFDDDTYPCPGQWVRLYFPLPYPDHVFSSGLGESS